MHQTFIVGQPDGQSGGALTRQLTAMETETRGTVYISLRLDLCGTTTITFTVDVNIWRINNLVLLPREPRSYFVENPEWFFVNSLLVYLCYIGHSEVTPGWTTLVNRSKP